MLCVPTTPEVSTSILLPVCSKTLDWVEGLSTMSTTLVLFYSGPLTDVKKRTVKSERWSRSSSWRERDQRDVGSGPHLLREGSPVRGHHVTTQTPTKKQPRKSHVISTDNTLRWTPFTHLLSSDGQNRHLVWKCFVFFTSTLPNTQIKPTNEVLLVMQEISWRQ